MAIRSGRVGVRHDQVDHYGRIKNVAGGIYSNLSAGSLVSSASAESSNVNTPSSFTGKIDLTSIKGNTIKWNQLVPINWVSTRTFSDGLSVTNNNDGSYTLNGTATQSRFPATNTEIKGIQEHKYYIQVLSSQNKVTISQNSSSVFIYSSVIYTAQNNNAFVIYFNENTYSNEKVVPMIIDLTQMFGAGNEPTTVDQFKLMFPLDYYEYDTGSLLSFNASALQNAFTGEEIHLPTLAYFPTGMKSAGSVYDELTPVKASIRTKKEIYTSSTGWITRTTGSGWILYEHIPGDIKNVGTAESETIKSNRFEWSLDLSENNTIRQVNTSITVRKDDITSLDAWGTYLASNPLEVVYQLATPIETDIDADFNLSLNVNEGENLQLLPLGTDTPASAPLRASVTSYKSGATGNDVEKLLGSIAQVETSPATGNHSVGDYIMYNYQLYKVTASITTGGSLVVGTNITATTVMDEFKTL